MITIPQIHLEGTTEQKIEQIRRYMLQLVDIITIIQEEIENGIRKE